MGPLDALHHLVDFFLPALGLGAIAAGLAKLVFRRELAGVPWARLAAWSALAAAGMTLGGLLLLGRDGRMATYAAMVAAAALALWWVGFGRR